MDRSKLGSRARWAGATLAAGLLVYWWFCLPRPLFRVPYATQLLSREGELLSAHVAADGQWRMPAPDSVSAKLITAVIAFEDRTFYHHWGVSPRGILRAVRDNWRAGRIVSGGSTLTMQVARLARGNRRRTLGQKIIEALWATRLEWTYDKSEILRLWLSHAPFGGNVVGVESAARRYYGRSPAELSWAEAATLAVLPNSPGLIHPGRSRGTLRLKRNKLLDRLRLEGYLTPAEADLAKLETLPLRPRPLPHRADHLLQTLRQTRGEGRYASSLDAGIQEEVTRLVADHQRQLAGRQIHNVAALVSEVATGRVVAYVGNAPRLDAAHAPAVDMIPARRSPGSLLKPILYALAQDEGKLLPRQLLRDVPVSFAGFQPANFYRQYDGVVPADEALARSLNIPFVYLLRDLSTDRFHNTLKRYGFGLTALPPDHYGLSLILGGAEVSMLEVNAWFLGAARQLRYFAGRQGRYDPADFLPPTTAADRRRDPLAATDRLPHGVSAGATYRTFEALTQLERPDETGRAHRFSSHRPVAWKTGTSFGYRDAWASGCTPAYAVTVWTGNADGTGRDGLVGVKTAAPLLFRIFRTLEGRSPAAPRWFEPPWDDLRAVTTCQTSGYLAGPDCPVREEWVARGGERAPVCPHHHPIFTNTTGQRQVRQDCYEGKIVRGTRFTLPITEAYYYRRRHGGYASPPPFAATCRSIGNQERNMRLIYPFRDGNLTAARDWRGEQQDFLFELAHRRPQEQVHWHLDGHYLTTTTGTHQLSLPVAPGRHRLAVVDGRGERLERRFRVRK